MELGICTDFNPETGEFVYVIGMEVEKDTPAPEGTVYKSFPELEYAVFTTPKSNEESFTSSIQSTWNYVFTEWFPESGYEHYGSMEFELYDKRCYGSENKEIDIYIPVKNRLLRRKEKSIPSRNSLIMLNIFLYKSPISKHLYLREGFYSFALGILESANLNIPFIFSYHNVRYRQ